jgi:hypothetical protein
MRPSPSSRALEAIVRDLIETRDGATYFAKRVWGAGLRYDLGGDHPLVGRSMPDFELADAFRLNEHLRRGRGLLLDLDARPSRRRLADRWGDRIDYVASDTKDRHGLSGVLVRPDGFVAWASDFPAGDEKLAQAALRWFGDSGK